MSKYPLFFLAAMLVLPSAFSDDADQVVIRGNTLAAGVSPSGDIVRVEQAGVWKDMRAAVSIEGCVRQGETVCRKIEGGGVEFQKTLGDETQHRACIWLERLRPTQDSLRWEVEIVGQGEPWGAAVQVTLDWPDPEHSQFWTAWADPDHLNSGWQDPLVFRPFRDLQWWYGAPPFREDKPLVGYCPTFGDVFSIPIATIVNPEANAGFSLVLSPEDTMIDLTLTTDKHGHIAFSHLNHRITPDHPLRFAMDLVPHEADWRAALGWIVKRYPSFFESPNPKVHELAGCGAYSSYEGPLDAAKFKKMAFRINWKASFDFPYMGMFLPPVKDDDERWPRFGLYGYPAGVAHDTSIRQMNDYAQRMEDAGFHVLSYFNVTEFGKNLKGPEAADPNLTDADAWKNANNFVYPKIADGILYNASGGTWGTWGAAVAMDPGGPNYQAFLLDQARRHIDKLPAAAGICIDRLDWLRFFNPRADDGVSWLDGKPVRSLFMSWAELMGKLGPMMHQAGKVIFVNNHLKRIDLLREVDGIYCEFGQFGTALNGIAVLGVHKPVLAWTATEQDLKPDPDAYFQRRLYLGVYPTAPLPQNDHTINPSEWAEPYYLDYGPLLDAMRGRKWVLAPHAIEVADAAARANLFEVPGGYIIPVAFGGNAATARITVRNTPSLTKGPDAPACEAMYSGDESWHPVQAAIHGNDLQVETPLQRGCVLVRVRL